MKLSQDDVLEPLGLGFGILLILIGLATLVGMPWVQKGSALVGIGQVVGAVIAILFGVGLAWLGRMDQ